MLELKTRTDVIDVLARAAHRGSLGLFLGTGFSMAVTRGTAPNWKTLLQGIADTHGFADPFENKDNIGKSMAELASDLVRQQDEALSKNKAYSTLDSQQRYALAVSNVKEAAAKRVAPLQPNKDDHAAFNELFHSLKPSWVVTTNYDDLFQKIHGKTRTFLPNDVLVPTDGLVPVWHIHGTVVEPKSVVLTLQDYIEHLRPATYRQSKLAHLMVESTTLMLGYGYGDVNVQTAATIARSGGLLDVRAGKRPGDSLIVHLNRQAVVTEDVNFDYNGNASIQSTEIMAILKEIVEAKSVLNQELEMAGKVFEKVKLEPEKVVAVCLKSLDNFKKFTTFVQTFPTAYYDYDVIAVLGRLFTEISDKAYASGGFPYYGIWLNYVLTMLLEWGLADMPPSIFDMLANQLTRVVAYLDPDGNHTFGTSFSATDAWKQNKAELAKRNDLLNALQAYCRRNSGGSILELLIAKAKI